LVFGVVLGAGEAMRRRDFIALLGGVAGNWPLVVRAQQPALPIVALINAGSADGSAPRLAAFRKGLSEVGYVEGQNVTVEYHFEGQYDRLPALVADLVRRRRRRGDRIGNWCCGA
jgi:putative tryptophan/tyrosine transport system substrate-binding protein